MNLYDESLNGKYMGIAISVNNNHGGQLVDMVDLLNLIAR